MARSLLLKQFSILNVISLLNKDNISMVPNENQKQNPNF